ncbi:MAG: hypothetical protein LC687_00050 [Actinobacteria bacterium]|nr:hypothetical protein [Actinomycetota bacterium]
MSATQAKVARIPDCDFCKAKGKQTRAYADARTWTGTWAYVCRTHFAANSCELGLGKGQELILIKR